MLVAIGEPVVGVAAVDFSLVSEDRADPADRFQCQGGRRALPGPAEVGEFEEATPGMGPAERFGDRPTHSRRRIELAEAAIGVGLQDPGIAGEMLLGVFAAAIARVVEEDSRRTLAKGAIVADIRP